MERDIARKIIAAVLNEIDYDLYKQYFVEDCIEDPEEVEAALEELVELIQGIASGEDY